MILNDLLKKHLQNVHENAINFLSQVFDLSNKPDPIKIVIDNDMKPFGIIEFYEGPRCIKRSDGYWMPKPYMKINENVHVSEFDFEITAIHETAHYLHSIKSGRSFFYLGDHTNERYFNRELVVVSSCFLYLENKNRIEEYKDFLRSGEGDYYNEKIMLEIVNYGLTPKEIIDIAINQPTTERFIEFCRQPLLNFTYNSK